MPVNLLDFRFGEKMLESIGFKFKFKFQTLSHAYMSEVFPIPMLLPSFFTVLMAKPQSFTITVVNTVNTSIELRIMVHP